MVDLEKDLTQKLVIELGSPPTLKRPTAPEPDATNRTRFCACGGKKAISLLALDLARAICALPT
eukprot:2757455-Rhodomonas_salina.1